MNKKWLLSLCIPLSLAIFLRVQAQNKSQPARAPQTRLPKVELSFNNVITPGDWSGKRFRDIMPPRTVKRIIRVRQPGLYQFNTEAPATSDSEVQARYDALFSHLEASNTKAERWGRLAQERVLAELMVVTNDGQLFRIEVVGNHLLGDATSQCALLIYGQSKSARIEVEGFQYTKPLK